MVLENQQVIDSLKKGEHSVLRTIYQDTRKEFQRWAYTQYSVPSGETDEIFQTSIIIFYEKVTSERLQLSSHWKTYLFAIGKNKIREYLRASAKTSSLDTILEESEPLDDEDEWQGDEQADLVIKCLDTLGAPCKDLIVAFYYKKLALEDISVKLGYKNSNSAKNQKFKCMQRLKDLYIQTAGLSL
jgi:RNA polymerase sigma factor (sigma-70 family)